MGKWLNFGNKVINIENINYIEFIQFNEIGLETIPTIKIFFTNKEGLELVYRDVRVAEDKYNEIIEYLREG